MLRIARSALAERAFKGGGETDHPGKSSRARALADEEVLGRAHRRCELAVLIALESKHARRENRNRTRFSQPKAFALSVLTVAAPHPSFV